MMQSSVGWIWPSFCSWSDSTKDRPGDHWSFPDIHFAVTCLSLISFLTICLLSLLLRFLLFRVNFTSSHSLHFLFILYAGVQSPRLLPDVGFLFQPLFTPQLWNLFLFIWPLSLFQRRGQWDLTWLFPSCTITSFYYRDNPFYSKSFCHKVALQNWNK